MKKALISVAVACGVLVGCIGATASAAYEEPTLVSVSLDRTAVVPAGENAGNVTRATSRIEWDVPADAVMRTDVSFRLEADETVTINCSYSPRTADLDFGLIGPDDTFHFVSGSGGSIRTTIQVSESGSYYFAVRNHTSREVEVMGYVYY